MFNYKSTGEKMEVQNFKGQQNTFEGNLNDQ
jgi:hypothetical protein